jgi:sulfite exporter TauE/SafE
MELLLFSAFTIGSLHALAPDHWIPFVALAKAQQWSKWKTTYSVFLAGLGHVSSSVVIGVIGIAIGVATEHVTGWETVRGNVASLLLIGFGLAYMVYGLKQLGKKHTHRHEQAKTVSYWTLFILIIFGPCEPLIPLLFASSAFGWFNVVLLVTLFGAATIVMMQIQVHAALWGFSFFKTHIFEHASDAIAGGVIVITGIAIRFFGI